MFERLMHEESGQTMAEYAVVLAVITLAVILTFQALGGGITTALQTVIDNLPGGGG